MYLGVGICGEALWAAAGSQAGMGRGSRGPLGHLLGPPPPLPPAVQCHPKQDTEQGRLGLPLSQAVPSRGRLEDRVCAMAPDVKGNNRLCPRIAQGFVFDF